MDTRVKDNVNIGTDFRMRVGEAWVGPESRETMQVINPSSGMPIADVPVATTRTHMRRWSPRGGPSRRGRH